MADRSDAKNLEAISRAIDQHNENCPGKVIAILMNPFEVERLGWDEIRGIPIEADEKIGTGRFRLVCDGVHDRNQSEESERHPGYVEEGTPDGAPEREPAGPLLV